MSEHAPKVMVGRGNVSNSFSSGIDPHTMLVGSAITHNTTSVLDSVNSFAFSFDGSVSQ